MPIVSNSLKSLSSFLENHQVSFSNGLLILFTIGGEQIFKESAFKCPCSQPRAAYYAMTFMFVPALILGIIGVAVSNLTWRVFHGCRKRERTSSNGCWNNFVHFTMIVTRAAIVPCAWLFITLLDGNYYLCMRAKNPCEAKQNNAEEFRNLVAESQTIAWVASASLILMSVTVICIVRCCFDSMTHMQYRYINSYREAEQQKLDDLIQESAQKLAKTNAEAFLMQEELKKEDWDDISRSPYPITELKVTGDKGDKGLPKPTASKSKKSEVFLTHLHEWVKYKKEITTPVLSQVDQPDQIPV